MKNQEDLFGFWPEPSKLRFIYRIQRLLGTAQPLIKPFVSPCVAFASAWGGALVGNPDLRQHSLPSRRKV